MKKSKFRLTPTQFKAKTEVLPDRFQFLNQNEVPIFEINNIPENTKSLAITLIDKDAPGTEMIYWILYNLPKDIRKIDPVTILLGDEGNNSVFQRKYYGPNPVEGKHRYEFRIYSLNIEKLHPDEGILASELLELINTHTIESDTVETYVEITGSYALG